MGIEVWGSTHFCGCYCFIIHMSNIFVLFKRIFIAAQLLARIYFSGFADSLKIPPPGHNVHVNNKINNTLRVVQTHAQTPLRATSRAKEGGVAPTCLCRFALLALHFLACLHRIIVRSAPPYERTGKPERSM